MVFGQKLAYISKAISKIIDALRVATPSQRWLGSATTLEWELLRPDVRLNALVKVMPVDAAILPRYNRSASL